MIDLKNMTVRYGHKTVVDNVSASTGAGQFVALVGPNGSGKSSLLKAIAGLLPFEGTTSLPASNRERARKLAYLAQNSTAPHLRKVEDIIALGRTPFLGPLSKMQSSDRIAIQTAAQTCETESLFGRTYGTLSGGEQMRVHLSRAIATDAPLLLADEPTTALDPYYKISLMNILKGSANSGKTLIVALHDLDLAKQFADQIWVMQSGKLVANAPATIALSDTVMSEVFRVSADGKVIR